MCMWPTSLGVHCRLKRSKDGLSGLLSGSEVRQHYVWSRVLFFAFASSHDFRYAKEDKKNSRYAKGLLANPDLPGAQSQQ